MKKNKLNLMSLTCKQCGSKIIQFDFSEEQKLEIWELIAQDYRLSAVKKIKDEYLWNHKDAKIIVAHFNKDFGKCHRCEYDKLEGENTDCPKCKAFNYNLKIEPPFNR
ncbi:hypothetical protein [Aureispira anguillae]|uniref:Uncharacterized protein n=1 Tax=Aureispira anguillae TaxID=2864201 RepID=A0A915YHD4_9BACT|nr:hypothetical protein [Aureispira anguillae]BDS13039.1 hypothetical protein AsAng_0037670 [Aureispira anguillae]